ncbi:MAG: type II toxin-antitoxin system mRNA interferase toxin, RelE/StbE family [archaeon]
MNYKLFIEDKVDKKFFKISKKNKKQLLSINKKILQIQQNPFRFKPLKGELSGLRRVHIDKSFVLIYEIDEKNRLIRVLDFDHHDNIY